MTAWVDRAIACLENGQEIILVDVAEVKGSAPRETGAKMLVAADSQWFTIGGGNLEWQALAKAREYLSTSLAEDCFQIDNNADGCGVDKPGIRLDIFQLGPSLGQCCGGVVGLLFERLRFNDLPWLKFLQTTLSERLTVQREVISPKNDFKATSHISLQVLDESVLTTADQIRTSFKRDTAGGLYFQELIQPESMDVYVFGAGHVGQALVHILATLPCRLTWVDSRTDQFPVDTPANVLIEDTDIPEAVIANAKPGSCYVIMTHDHALDQRLCEHILKRGDALFFGLIGSQTKRRKFEHRFQAKGIDSSSYDKMICPIGIPTIKGKQPAVIALAVAAQLMSIQSNKGSLNAHKSVANTI